MLTHLRNNPLKRAILAMVLPGVAGMVNAVSLFTVGAYTSHVTGTVTRLGYELSRGDLAGLLHVGSALLAFLVGVMGAATLVELARRQARARYAAPLLLEALALAAVIVGSYLGPRAATPEFGLLCFAMGMQNSLVTRISGAVVRTTHLTGTVTDIGVELVQFLLWSGGELRGRSARGWLRDIPALFRDSRFARLGLLLRIGFSFLAGAIVGPLLYERVRELTLGLPVLIVLALALYDIRSGLELVTLAKAMHQEAPLAGSAPPPLSTSAPDAPGT